MSIQPDQWDHEMEAEYKALNPFWQLKGQKFNLLYVDPPWSYNDKCKNRGGAERHYSTMNIEDIKNLPIGDICEKDSLLFMWATFPLLPEALAVIESWGFKYKTCGFTWVKQNKKSDGLYMGMGGYTRSNAEICLIAKRGKGVKRIDCSVRQTQIHRLQEHSKKPDSFRASIDQLYGEVSKLELFARSKHEGWSCWGNEV